MTVATYKQISINAIQTFLTDYEVVLYETPLWQYLNYFYTLWKRISVADASVLYDAQIYNADQVLTLDDELDTIFEKINI